MEIEAADRSAPCCCTALSWVGSLPIVWKAGSRRTQCPAPPCSHIKHVDCSTEISIATHVLSTKHVHMSVQDPGQEEGWIFLSCNFGTFGGCLHCAARGNRKWDCVQLGATAPEREAALWGSEVLSYHQHAPLQGWSAELLALLQGFQQVVMSVSFPSLPAKRKETTSKHNYSCPWALLGKQLIKYLMYLNYKGIRAMLCFPKT